MKSRSTGIAAASRPMTHEGVVGRAGFTLIEALVAMALLLAFLSVLVPHLFYARRIADHIDDRVAAQVLLRTLLDAPVDRAALGKGPREGEAANGLHWSVAAEPMFIDAMVPVPEEAARARAPADKDKKAPVARRHWIPFRLIGSVSWGGGHVVNAETLRLGLANDGE